jgi:hypothetical protein
VSSRRLARDDLRLPHPRARAPRRGHPRPQRDRRAARRRRPTRLPFSFLFVFLGARPCTDWLGDVVARDENGFILTGAAARGEYLLETSVQGVFAAGDVRSGSTKRCASAVGEGAMAVQLVHAYLAQPRTRNELVLPSRGARGDRTPRRKHDMRRRMLRPPRGRRRGGLGLTGHDPGSRVAHVGAVKVEPDAPHQLEHVRLAEAGVRIAGGDHGRAARRGACQCLVGQG